MDDTNDNPFQDLFYSYFSFDGDSVKPSLDEGMSITNTLLLVEALYEADEWRTAKNDYLSLVSYINLLVPYISFLLDSEVEYFKSVYESVARFQSSKGNNL